MKYIFVILLLLNGCGSYRQFYDNEKIELNIKEIQDKSIVITKGSIVKFDKKINDFLILQSSMIASYVYSNKDHLFDAVVYSETFQYNAISFDEGIHYLYIFDIDLEYYCNRRKNPTKYCFEFCLIDNCHCDPCFLEYKTYISSYNGDIPYEERNSAYAYFNTNPNEIVYIGDLAFTENGLEYLDSYEEAKQWFYKEYPQFKDKPVIKRIATLGPYAKNISLKK